MVVGLLLRISAGVSFEQDFPEFRPQLSESSWLVCKFRDTFSTLELASSFFMWALC